MKPIIKVVSAVVLLLAALTPVTVISKQSAAGDLTTASVAPTTTSTIEAPTTTTTAAPRTVSTEATRDYDRYASTTTTAAVIVHTSSGRLARIAVCESHNNYTAQNRHSTASGKYQVLDSTWGHFGGYSRAMYAPPAVQEEQAQQMYARDGASPWNASRSCWG